LVITQKFLLSQHLGNTVICLSKAIIDCVIAELEARFSDNSSTTMIETQTLTPKHPSFLEYEKIAPYAQLSNSNIEDISRKVYKLKRLLEHAEQNK
jgi:hypothetical protein